MPRTPGGWTPSCAPPPRRRPSRARGAGASTTAGEGTPGQYEDGDPVHIRLGCCASATIAIGSANAEIYHRDRPEAQGAPRLSPSHTPGHRRQRDGQLRLRAGRLLPSARPPSRLLGSRLRAGLRRGRHRDMAAVDLIHGQREIARDRANRKPLSASEVAPRADVCGLSTGARQGVAYGSYAAGSGTRVDAGHKEDEMPWTTPPRFASIAVLTSLLLFRAVPRSEAAPQTPPPEFRADTAVVLLDVIARDRKGRPVRDLVPEELQVNENGQRCEIRSFAFVESERTLEPSQSPGAGRGPRAGSGTGGHRRAAEPGLAGLRPARPRGQPPRGEGRPRIRRAWGRAAHEARRLQDRHGPDAAAGVHERAAAAPARDRGGDRRPRLPRPLAHRRRPARRARGARGQQPVGRRRPDRARRRLQGQRRTGDRRPRAAARPGPRGARPGGEGPRADRQRAAHGRHPAAAARGAAVALSPARAGEGAAGLARAQDAASSSRPAFRSRPTSTTSSR